jgi:predicted adenine nucleotide alpha hydrolase (AANH) superfamily ATPase
MKFKMPDKLFGRIHCVFYSPNVKPKHRYLKRIDESYVVFRQGNRWLKYYAPYWHKLPLVYNTRASYPIEGKLK